MAKPDQVSEVALIQRVLSGDSAAFYDLVSPYEAKAYRAAYAILQNQADAEEVVQEALLKGYKHLKDFRGEAKFSTWLLQILVNEARLRLRRSRHTREESFDELAESQGGFAPKEMGEWGDDPEQKYAAEELRQLVREAIETLPAGYRVVLVMRDMEGFGNAEVAASLSLSVPAVKTRLLRARLMLRERLAPHFQKRWFDALPFLGRRVKR